MPIGIYKLTELELIDLNHRIVARLKLLQHVRADDSHFKRHIRPFRAASFPN